MIRSLALAAALAASGQVAPAAGAPDPAPVRHDLRVTLEPARHWLAVTDAFAVPSAAGRSLDFLLNAALKIDTSDPPLVEVPFDPADGSRFFGIAPPSGSDPVVALKRYRVVLPAAGSVRLAYEGRFDFGLGSQKEEHARGFRETAGIVSPEGLYLPPGGFWYPYPGPGLVEYRLEVSQPAGWQVVAPGRGTSRDAEGQARWDSQGALEDVTLAGGPLVVYRDHAGPVESLVYLREKDDALAARYLQATAQYLELYRGLVGPYPYAKFALVENFWETGYGMPSFALLGSQVIRFPFILTSSYPHEILHDWWGNSVFVDLAGGNWCEGLTAYMADHLIQEQRGRGEEYRRDALQRYRSYVHEGRDFALAAFHSRHNAATEAVGYGKGLMVFHMLRQKLGDDGFRRWAAAFYRDYRGRRASFEDVRRSAEAVLGADLGRFFADHVGRPGAARLAVSLSDLRDSTGDGYDVAFVLEQTQAGEPLALDVPIVVQTTGEPEVKVVHMTGRLAGTTVRTDAEPLALYVDPSFDVFRLLDARETPPSIGQIFGEPRVLAVIAASAPAGEQAAYRALVESWRSDGQQPEIRSDAELGELPPDRAVWLLGRTNALAARLFASGADYTLDGSKLAVGSETMPLAGHAVVVVRRHPANAEQAIGWIFADRPEALSGLARKLPHYGKYSYLGFAGDGPTNVLKGQWQAADSPLLIDLRPNDERTTPLPRLRLPTRRALAELPPP